MRQTMEYSQAVNFWTSFRPQVCILFVAGAKIGSAALVAAGKLNPQVGPEASWRDHGPAIEALLERRVAGKAVLYVD